MKHLFLIISIISIAFSNPLKAEKTAYERSTYRVKFGENIGGTLPMPFPAEIRKITSFNPLFSPYVAIEATRWFSQKWGVTAGLALDIRGMAAGADVLYFNTELTVGEGEQSGVFNGTYSGFVEMRPKNIYVTLPVMAAYRFNSAWDINFGLYVSYLGSGSFKGVAKDGYMRTPNSTGERIDITSATFDFADELRKFDCGLMVGGNWNFWGNFGAYAHFIYGFIPIFPGDFEGVSGYRMTNLYGSLGLSYKL
ncbi:MAG: porin family protein [Bacteroidales bacterium]|nr:porin family protein [Bacteroidales bacterium]